VKIDIVVHGRFHAYHLARELLRRGHDVVVFTNYPKHIVARFGIPPEQVVTNVVHGIAARLIHKLASWLPVLDAEPWVLQWFGRWAARRVRHDADCVHAFSGVALETFSLSKADYPPLRLLMRGSSHVRVQRRLLQEEQERCGHRVEQPSDWMVAREEAEYAVSDKVVVLSGFAQATFIESGLAPERLALVPLGAALDGFRAPPAVLEARLRRLRNGEGLRILMVGSFSPRKGALDYLKVAGVSLGHCRFVGEVSPENEWLRQAAGKSIEFIGRVPEHELPAQYHWADVFVFPTIEDGYAMVIAQAMAAGLPVISTLNCAAPDMVTEGRNGWLVPIRRPDLIVQRLQWCDANREAFAGICQQAHTTIAVRDWSAVAADFEVAAGAHR
jgi:glycosyltransferase involved in cell wall biosynthesis